MREPSEVGGAGDGSVYVVQVDLNNLAGAFHGRGLAEEVTHLLVAYL